MSQCVCETEPQWTDYPDFRHVRTNNNAICPEHDHCEYCGDNPAEVMRNRTSAK
jgi:hypothetical protein